MGALCNVGGLSTSWATSPMTCALLDTNYVPDAFM